MHTDNSRRRYSAEAVAGGLWKDVVFRRIERRDFVTFADADRQFSSAMDRFESEADAALRLLYDR